VSAPSPHFDFAGIVYVPAMLLGSVCGMACSDGWTTASSPAPWTSCWSPRAWVSCS